VLLHVGSGFERKGVPQLLHALSRAGNAPWAIVAGKDKRAADAAALARRLGIGERVRFVGAVSDVRPYYAAADAFVLATLYDPQPNAALEAMACGLPVVTTRQCGAAELIREGESGFVRDALDVDGIAECIGRVDLGTARALGQAARAAVEPFTPSRWRASTSRSTSACFPDNVGMSVPQPAPTSASLYRRLLAHVWPYRGVLAAGVAR
jgi:UDP-glucose:(heptosyl)LPS alpha-1,3-glucosyltransferase